MTRFFNVIVGIFMAVAVGGFTPVVRPTTASTGTKTPLYAARRRPSPRLDEALASYPYRFRPEGEKAGTKSACSAAFNELARLYGDDEALAMIRIEPRVFRFRRENFEPCLEAWTEQFGREAAQAMVARNPGLLGILPAEARRPAEASMAMSYVVGVTRPLPKIIAAGGLLAILTAGLR